MTAWKKHSAKSSRLKASNGLRDGEKERERERATCDTWQCVCMCLLMYAPVHIHTYVYIYIHTYNIHIGKMCTRTYKYYALHYTTFLHEQPWKNQTTELQAQTSASSSASSYYIACRRVCSSNTLFADDLRPATAEICIAENVPQSRREVPNECLHTSGAPKNRIPHTGTPKMGPPMCRNCQTISKFVHNAAGASGMAQLPA